MSSTTSKQLLLKPNERRHQVKCPVCKKSRDWFAGKYGPFCSHQCKLIDLGQWLGEEHAISEPLRPEHLQKFASVSPGEIPDQRETNQRRGGGHLRR